MFWRAGMQEAGVGGGLCVWVCVFGTGVGVGTGAWATLPATCCCACCTPGHCLPAPSHRPLRASCRLEELEAIGQEWRALQVAAHELDRRLRQTPWRTLCHGKHSWVALCVAEAQLCCRTRAGGHSWHPHRSAFCALQAAHLACVLDCQQDA